MMYVSSFWSLTTGAAPVPPIITYTAASYVQHTRHSGHAHIGITLLILLERILTWPFKPLF